MLYATFLCGHIKCMFPILAQVKYSLDSHNVIYKSEFDTLSNGESLFLFKQILMLIFEFSLRNSTFLTLKLKNTFPVII